MLWAVIMAGGAGTRFWPESRAAFPKQFLPIFGPQTLLRQTCDRLKPIVSRKHELVVTRQDYVPQVRKILPFLSGGQILGEPVGRNTAPCAILAAALALKKDPEAVLALLPSDHKIGKPEIFRSILTTAAELSTRHRMPVTLGIRPDFPHTGYGYLELGQSQGKDKGHDYYLLKKFHEKPDPIRAAHFLKTRRFLWNSGVFVWRAADLMTAAEKFLPAACKVLQKIMKGNFKVNFRRYYPEMPDISIDYALMEKLTGKILTVPADINWHDLGGWPAFGEMWPKDSEGNVVRGRALLIESSGNIIKSGRRLIAGLGLRDMIIVDTDDALLICPKSKAETIRKIVQALKDKKMGRYL